MKPSHPACEWKPSLATSRETRLPMKIRAAIRRTLAIQMATVPMGSSSQARGNRSCRRPSQR